MTTVSSERYESGGLTSGGRRGRAKTFLKATWLSEITADGVGEINVENVVQMAESRDRSRMVRSGVVDRGGIVNRLVVVWGRGSPGPAIRLSGGFRVTRQRSGAGRAAVTEDGGVRRPLPEPATGRDCSSSTTSVNHRGPPSMSRRAGYPYPEQMDRKMLRNVEKRGVHTARNSSSSPSCVAKAEMSMADRLGSREGSSRAGPPQGWGVSR